MMKLMEYTRSTNRMENRGATDEEMLAFVTDYKKTTETQDQQPLLFQTMTADHTERNLYTLRSTITRLKRLNSHILLASVCQDLAWSADARRILRAALGQSEAERDVERQSYHRQRQRQSMVTLPLSVRQLLQ